MKIAFADTVYWQALIDVKDDLHDAAKALTVHLKANRVRIITSESECPFEMAFELYAKRPDKQWGHTDCSSFRLMERRGIADALTHDNHFRQAGFSILL